MTIIIFVLLVISEAALLIASLARGCGKLQWQRDRALSRGIEFLLLLGFILLPFTYMKWRFTGALILLGILLLIAGILWLNVRKKADSAVKKSRVIMSAVLSVVMIGFALFPAFVFKNYNGLETSGAYEVRECSAILIDENREDPFENDGSLREVPVHFYYPDAEGSFPLVIFSHGAFGYYQSNYSTYAELVSNGYVVVSLDHPHHAFFTKNSKGKTVIVDTQFISDAVAVSNGEKSMEEEYALFREWMALRTADVNFVLDTIEAAKDSGAAGASWYMENEDEIRTVLGMIDTEHIGVMGHSMGGATAVSAGRTRDDVDAVIVLDGTMLDEITGFENGTVSYNETPYPVPVLEFGKEADYSEDAQAQDAQAQDAYQFAYVNRYVMEHAKEGKTVVFENVGHMDFTDLPLFSPMLSSMLGSEKIDHEAFMKQVNGLVLDWFDCYLKGTPDMQAAY